MMSKLQRREKLLNSDVGAIVRAAFSGSKIDMRIQASGILSELYNIPLERNEVVRTTTPALFIADLL